MKRCIEITTDLGTEDDPLKLSVDDLGLTIATGAGRVVLTSEQWTSLLDEWANYRRIVEAAAVPLMAAAE